MIIIHCLKETTWNSYKNKNYYGDEYLKQEGFIHCSEITTYLMVAPNFKDIEEKLLLLVIDTTEVEAQIEWEDLCNCKVEYPHIYGLLNKNAIISVLPHLWDENRNWVMNEELKQYA